MDIDNDFIDYTNEQFTKQELYEYTQNMFIFYIVYAVFLYIIHMISRRLPMVDRR
jgi:hypothetical protein